MLERQEALDGVARVLAQARGGTASALFVVGEAGIGKTSVLDRARGLAGEDVRVGSAAGEAMAAAHPFGLLGAAFTGLGGAEALQNHSGRRDDISYAALRWLQGLGPKPLLLALDDIHWGDPDSLELLSFLSRRAGRMPLAIVATLRPWPAEAFDMARALGERWGAELCHLRPLSEEAAGRLLRERLGEAVDRGLCRRLWTAAAGNPLLLEEAADATGVSTDAPDLRPNGLLLRRFAGLDRAALAYAQAASVLGARFHPAVAASLAEMGARDTAVALEAMRASGLVRTDDAGTASFVHPLLQQVLYEDLGEARRRWLHRRAYRLLEDEGYPAEAAEHVRRARPSGDVRAVALLEKQGREALRAGAPATAVRYLDSAVELAGAEAGAGALLAVGQARAMAGQHVQAVAAYKRALDSPELTWRERVGTLHTVGRSLFALAEQDGAEAHFAEAVGLCAADDPELAVRCLIDQALTAWLTSGPAYSLPFTVTAAEIARRASARTRSQVAVTRGFIAFLHGDGRGIDEAAAGIDELGPGLLLDTRDLTWSMGLLRAYAVGAWMAERFPESDRALGLIREEAERLGSVEGVVAAGLGALDPIIQRGRLADALALVEQLDPLADLVPVARPFIDMRAAAALQYLDRLEESEAVWERAMAAATATGHQTAVLYLLEVRGRRHRHEGRAPEAADLFERIEAMDARLGIGEPCLVRWARSAVLTHVELGRIEDASRVAATLAERAERLPCRWPRIALATARAALAEHAGSLDEAERWHRSALELHEGVPLALEQVETMLEYGAFLRRRSRAGEARVVLDEALRLATAHDAAWLARLVRRELP